MDLLNDGGFYFIDELLPEPPWPEGHVPKLGTLVERIRNRPDLASIRLFWSMGLVIAVMRCGMSHPVGTNSIVCPKS